MGTLFGNRNASGPHNRRNAEIIGGLTGGAGAMIHSGIRASKGLPGMTKQHMKGAAIAGGISVGLQSGGMRAYGNQMMGKSIATGFAKGAVRGGVIGAVGTAAGAGIGSAVGKGIGKTIRKVKGK